MRTALLTSIVMLAAGPAAAQQVQVGDARVVEGNSGTRTVDVSVILSAPASGPVTMTYTARSGTADASDYGASSGTVAFSKGDLMKKVPFTVTGDTLIEGDETFEVVLAGVSGATLADGVATVTIVNDDLSAAGLSTYEVRFTFRGFTGSLESAPDCPVRRDGIVVMTGLLSGNERVPRDEDITYRGVLQFDANLDLCDAREARPGEHELCSISVAGSGAMEVELEAYTASRGGYVKVEKAPGASFVSALWGSCDASLIAEERKTFPDDSQAAIFNGLDTATPTPLRVGKYVQEKVVIEVLRVVRP